MFKSWGRFLEFRLLSSFDGLPCDAMSIATVSLWDAYFLFTLTFLTLIQILGRSGTFWFYGLLGIGAWFFVYFLVPETKGRSLEEIEAFWRAGKLPRAMGT